MKNKKRMKVIGGLFLCGTPSYILCTFAHTCMAGHLAHAPYPTWHWISEFLWLSCYTSSAVLSFRTKIKKRLWYLIGGAFLILSRIVLGSGGGGLLLVELPLVIYLIALSLRYVWENAEYIIKTEQII